MTAKTVQLPEPTFRELNSLKIRIVKSTDRIPTNGDIVRCALAIASAHYGELIAELTKETEIES